MARPPLFKGPTRFVGAVIPLELFELLEASRADLGIAERSEAIREAIELWVRTNPPKGELNQKLEKLVRATSQSRAVREALTAAVQEWRASGSVVLLALAVELSRATGLHIPPDVEKAWEEIRGGETDAQPR